VVVDSAACADVPERLIVGNERAFLTWFYERAAAKSDAIDAAATAEYLRTFSGREGVLGALGVYRAAFTTMEQTAPLTKKRVQVPVVALGGERAQGVQIRKMIKMVAQNVEGGSIADCGHFVPEERRRNRAPHPGHDEDAGDQMKKPKLMVRVEVDGYATLTDFLFSRSL
jgi:pimeloyl-ACP methyl ester carboxylesterase